MNQYLSLFTGVPFLICTFEQILIYAGFVLQLKGAITVYSFLKVTRVSGFKAPFKPYLEIGHLNVSSMILAYILLERSVESLCGWGLIITGALVFLYDKKIWKK